MRTLEWTQTSDQEEDQDEEEEDDDEDDAEKEKKQNELSKWQAKREIRPRRISVHFVALALMGIILVSTDLQAGAKIRGSEWSFDNQALQSVSSQFLCSQLETNQTGGASQQKQDNPPQTRQQVNVITFVGNQISSIEPNAFRCVAAELRVLVFTANEINLIQADAFEGLHSVQVLLLDSNRLDSIPSEASLAALKSLRHLNLADNQIERLDGSSFGPHLSGLISLNLAGNALFQVHPGALRHLVKLKTLTLSRCSNQSLDETPLDGLQELRFLHLDRAKPSARLRVTENLCRHSPKLSSLLLKSNAIERVPQFEHCQNLLLLDLSYNNIRGSLSENFTKLPNLIDLYLGNNQLEFVAERALLGLRQLQVLELQNNRIKQIEPRAFLPVQPSLEELNLSHNPKLNQLSALGLDNLKSLKCYGNHQLREMPHFKSALKLALTYAYHCCDYPQSSQQQQQRPLEEDAEKSLIVRLAHKHSSWSAASRSSNEEDDNELRSELILWPQPTNQAPAERGRHRRDNDGDHDGTWMDDDTELVSRELNRIRRQHSIFFVDEPLLETFPRHQASRSHANSNNSITSERRPRDLRRKLDESASQEVRCAPSPGPFLPCRDLFDSWWLRVGIWSVFLLAFLGNTLVIVVLSSVRQTSSSSALTSIMWLAHSKRHIDVPRFLVINLAIADLLMAIYLGLLAFVDMSTLGNFKLHAIRWQYSSGCKLAGFLAVLSSELSVFILAIITLERNYAITNAVHLNRRLSLQKAMFIMFLGYTFALAMAIMPLYGVSDYRRYSVCLPLDIESSLGSQIYVITLISINTFSFVLLLGCYLRMYFAIRGSQAWNANDLRIAKRMSILVLTDFLCWMPIVASGLASLFGYHLVGTEGMKTLTIFILPLNSVANPFLYAITTKKFKRDLSTLRRRARALVRFECVKQQAGAAGPVSCRPARHEPPHHHRHHQLQLQLGKHHSATCLNANNNQHRNHYRHDLLLVSHQHGSGGAKHQTATSKMRQMSEKNAAHRALNNLQLRSAPNQQTCITCSCQQRARFHNLDAPIEPQQQQQQLGPRIVLETATQTSRQPNPLETTTPPPQLLRKSRSTNSGLTMMAMRREEQRQIAFSPTNLMISSKAAENYPSRPLLNVVDSCFVRGDKSSAANEEVGAPSGGPLTKMEESILAEDSFGGLCHRQRQSRTILDADERDPSPSSSAASGHQRDRTRLDELVRPAASRSYLSVDPFQAPAASAGGADLRSASACGHLVSCRAADDDDHNLDKCQLDNLGLASGRKASRAGAAAGVGGSYDTVRVIGSGGGVGGGPMKLSRSIQRLLFGPLAKAWSSIQISLNSSAATHVGQQQLQPPYQTIIKEHCLDQAAGSRCGSNLGAAATACVGGDSGRVRPNEGDCLDDILMMSSPLKRSMRVGERRMSRSCDTIPKLSNNNNNNITTADLLQLNSPSHSSGQEQSSCDYDDDRRVLLATINRLATGGHRTRLVSGVNAAAPLVVEASDAGHQVGFGAVSNQLTMRGRCTRCRSWSPALLTKLENCIYQMKSKLSSGFVSQTANATRLASSRGFDGEQPCQVSYTTCPDKSHHSQISAGETMDYLQPRSATGQEQELEAVDTRLGDNQNDDDDDECEGECEGDELELNLNSQEGDDDSLDDQFGEPPELAQLRRLKINSMWPRRSTRLRQQSSVNSDTISTRTAGTLMTNMSISSDSTASIQLALASSSQPVRLDMISDTNDGAHDITK